MTILSAFTQPNVNTNLYANFFCETQQKMSEKCVLFCLVRFVLLSDNVLDPIYFHTWTKKVERFLKKSYFVFSNFCVLSKRLLFAGQFVADLYLSMSNSLIELGIFILEYFICTICGIKKKCKN